MIICRTPIRCYISPADNNKIAEWLKALLPNERTDADEFLKNMQKVRDWQWPEYRSRLSNGDGLGELRWQSGKKQHRLMGFFMVGYWYAVIGCTHKQQIYNPADALTTAKRRKKQIERGEVRTVDYDF